MPKPLVFFWALGVVVAGVAHAAGAEFTISPGTLRSTGPCVFSEQLRDSASVRAYFVGKLVKAASPAAPPVNANEGTKKGMIIQGIDEFSADCVGCHNGVEALLIKVDLRNGPSNVRAHAKSEMFGMDHPIGMGYSQYAAVNRKFKPLPRISKMVFVNGRVGCLTCHDPLNPEKGHLVMSDRQSALCLTCHNLGP